MPVIPVYDQLKKKVGELNLDERVFNVPFKKNIVYDAIVAHGVNRRRGTASTKTRAEVRGGGRKPFRQKGTGRARQGSIRDAHQVGGGVAFGPKPKKYHYALSKNAFKAALRTTLSQLLRDNRITVLKDFKLDQIKTKKVLAVLQNFSLEKEKGKKVEKGLIIDKSNANLEKSSSNLYAFKFLKPEGINVFDLLKFKNVLITEEAILQIEKRLQP